MEQNENKTSWQISGSYRVSPLCPLIPSSPGVCWGVLLFGGFLWSLVALYTSVSHTGDIDRCLKKVTEGVEQFEDIWQKVTPEDPPLKLFNRTIEMPHRYTLPQMLTRKRSMKQT